MHVITLKFEQIGFNVEEKQQENIQAEFFLMFLKFWYIHNCRRFQDILLSTKTPTGA